jgi:hypothetical protein
MSKRSDMRIGLNYPPGWVQLPIRPGKKLTIDKDLDAWADTAAREMLGGAPPEQVRQRARDLAELTIGCRARKDRYGFAFYPPNARSLVAMLDVKRSTQLPPRKPSVTSRPRASIYRADPPSGCAANGSRNAIRPGKVP